MLLLRQPSARRLQGWVNAVADSAVDIHALVSPPRGRFTAGLPPGDDGRLERIHGVPLGDGELSSDQGG
jgi:hypothetical protein